MGRMFSYAGYFHGDISKWDVANVRDMYSMFRSATSFNADISQWEVSSVTNMDYMFWYAASFNVELCQIDWIHSKASKSYMFGGSSGSISRTVCIATPASNEYLSRRPVFERELVVRTPLATSVSIRAIPSTTTHMMACAKCGTFKKSGRVSCCAPGGAWYKHCGGSGNSNAEYMWFEGVETCKRKFHDREHVGIVPAHSKLRLFSCFFLCGLISV